MQLSEIIEIVNGTLLNNNKLKKKIENITFDSRKVKKNDLYVCIIGKHKDGHDFIKEAIKNGAKAIIVSKNVEKYNVPIIKVKDTLFALEALASYKRDQFKGTVIAITGSVGKTTTKEMLALILGKKYRVLNSIGNKNNIYGLSETIFNLKKDTEVLVVELGMNHKGEIATLSQICKPDIAIITNIGSSHIGNLKSKKNIWKAKMEIITGMNKGKLFVNGDDKYLKKVKLKGKVDIVRSGIKNSDIKCLNYKVLLDQSEFTTDINHRLEHFKINLPGEHFIHNALLAMSVSLYMGLSVEDIRTSLAQYETYDQRYKIYRNQDITLIDDSYNSSYESLKANISTLKDDTKKLLIIGDILELGKKSKKIHKKVGKLLKKISGNIIIVGENMKVLSKKFTHFNHSEEVIAHLENQDLKGYKILVKGSRAVRLDIISNYIREKFIIKKSSATNE